MHSGMQKEQHRGMQEEQHRGMQKEQHRGMHNGIHEEDHHGIHHELEANRRNDMYNDELIDDDILKRRDIRALRDPFYPPWRRLPRHQYPPISVRRVMNIPTRGYADNFQLLGTLIRKTDEKAVQLYGREEYPGSRKWEYHGYTTDVNGLQIKFNIDNKAKELIDGEDINLPILDTSKGRFKLNLNQHDAPRYDPYSI
jgi:hypothetical protein